ncbi:bifunctional riboflavin kinase/FAD synthetase [Leucobacter sp. wl10]|uniref:bifunctional riboflavin kinase/FAD synthetase n=1 Tax=Leucobacter sp. wl10 TaxID=2304677 RepID=UPI000E5B3F37|nr:bifunctional riboflavin kinase/FAD synthetase [Leucobacter sp. wl10]RGE23158.1 bifunctional riboflavin kinase/FAD synthetase [Leucobacter sp. wl10]
MRVIEALEAISPEEFAGGSCVAIGKFDGLHRGHQAILRSVVESARAEGRRAVALTFANNPLSYLRPELCPQPLMSREQRLEAFEAAGIEVCVMLRFDGDIASIPAERFVAEVLVERLRARHIVMGADFRFGHRGAGDGALLRIQGERYGFSADVLELVEDGEAGQVSSSRVREAVLGGDVESAARMLGRPPAVRGEVVHGDARGREIGFPTANLGGELEGLVPADGVYAGWVVVRGERLVAAISVGANVTFDPAGESRVEAFVLDFDRDIYGERVEVQFARRLRSMERFESLEALIAQMRADVGRTRELLAP